MTLPTDDGIGRTETCGAKVRTLRNSRPHTVPTLRTTHRSWACAGVSAPTFTLARGRSMTMEGLLI